MKVRVQILEFDGFDYDLGNIKKIQSHGVSIGEIETFFEQELLVVEDRKHSSNSERRFIAVGQSKRGRAMFVAYTVRKKGVELHIRPISARYCHAKEAKIYENLKKSLKKEI
jgi:uncharacterized DUF497 family protein